MSELPNENKWDVFNEVTALQEHLDVASPGSSLEREIMTIHLERAFKAGADPAETRRLALEEVRHKYREDTPDAVFEDWLDKEIRALAAQPALRRREVGSEASTG